MDIRTTPTMPTVSACLRSPILLATDGSSVARAQVLLRPLAQLLGADPTAPLQVLTVQPRPQRWRRGFAPGPDAADLAAGDNPPDTEPAAEPSTAPYPSEPSVEPLLAAEIAHGRPTATILRYAQQMRAGLVAIEVSASTAPQALLWSRVAAAVARYAASHVLIVRGSVPAPTWRHVLLVVSPDRATQQAIAILRQILPLGVQRVTLLCVQPPLNTHYWYGPFASPAASWQLNQLLLIAQQEQAQRLVKQAEAVVNQSELAVTTLIEQRHNPAALICRMATEQQADLILLGSDSRFAVPDRPTPRPSRLTATGDGVIRHAPCPVLLCRAAAARSQPLRLPSLALPRRLYSLGLSGTR